MNDIIKIASNFIIITMALMIIVAIVNSYIEKHYGYEYLDMSDNFGIADKCYIEDKGLFCKVDSGLVEVKQFRKR